MFGDISSKKKIKTVLLVPLGIAIGWSLYSIIYLGDDFTIIVGASIIIYVLGLIISTLALLIINLFSKESGN